MVTLDEVCEVIQGQSPPGDTYNAIGKGTPFFQGKAEFGSVHPTVVKWCSSPTKIAEPDDILISIRAPVGPTNLCPVRACIGRGLAAIRPLGRVPSRYILYALRDSESDLASKGTGSTFAAISGAELRSHRIVLASLPAQHRIVAEIEKELARLDAAVGALKRVQANLKRYRASVLKAACEGRLVPTEAELARAEGRDYETGAQLLARILKERRAKWEADQLARMRAAGKPPKDDKWKTKYPEPALPGSPRLPGLPDGWAWVSVEQLGETTTGFTPPKQEAGLFGGNIPFFKPTDLNAGYYLRGSSDSLTERGAEHGRILPPLAILVTCIGATIGKTGLARVGGATNQQINALVVDRLLLFPEYLFWAFTSPYGQEQIRDNASATTLPILNKSRFQGLRMPLPPIEEQRRIVDEVERRYSVLDELESAITAGLKRAERLRQSILKRAFEGKLVPQDPNDEPTSALLERIRADRASGGGALRRFASGPRPPRQKRLGKVS